MRAAGRWFPSTRQPERYARTTQAFSRLHLGKGAHVAHDAIEISLPGISRKVRASAASRETRSSSKPDSHSFATFFGREHQCRCVEQLRRRRDP